MELLRGVLDPMTGAFIRARPNLAAADLKVCDGTIPAFDGKRRFDIRLGPNSRGELKAKKLTAIPVLLRSAG
jgi:hypothetical protein